MGDPGGAKGTTHFSRIDLCAQVGGGQIGLQERSLAPLQVRRIGTN